MGVFRTSRALLRAIWSIARRPSVFGVGMPILLGVGSDMTYGGDFTSGVCLLTLAAVWSVVFWLDSRLIKKKKPRRPRPRKGDYDEALRSFNGELVKYRLRQIGGVLAIVLLLAVSIAFIRGKRNEKELGELIGFLLPGSELTPQVFCLKKYPAADAVIVFFDAAAAVVSKFPHTVISTNGSPLLAIDKHSDGSVGINAKVVSFDGRIVAEIKNNEFIVNPNNYLQMARRDKRSLSVRDQYGKTVLDVVYLNPSAFRISSFVAYISPGDTVEIAPIIGPPRMCFEEAGGEQNKGDFDFSRTPGHQLVMTYKAYRGFGPEKSTQKGTADR